MDTIKTNINSGGIRMNELIITKENIDEFKNYLRLEEKSENTIEKYMRDIKAFWQYAETQTVTKELAIKFVDYFLKIENFNVLA